MTFDSREGSHAAAIVIGLSVVALTMLLAWCAPSHGQHNHAQHHDVYRNWVNQNGHGCCNDRDCGELAETDERTTAGALEVRVEGAWCPVMSWHYLRQGNAPNWGSAHACVLHPMGPTDKRGPCERLICYQPRPLF